MAIIKSGINESLIINLKDNLNNLKEIYELSSSTVYGLALSITKNKEDAEDVLHDTYLKIVDKSHTYTPLGKPLAWIITIARNLSLMKIRKRSNLNEYELIDNLSIKTNNPDDKLILESAFTILNDEEIEIIMLYSSGFKHKEIAELLNIPLSTILSKYNRSLKKMKEYLEGGKK